MSNRVIWKFPMPQGGWNAINIPRDAQVRLVGLDPATGQPTVWVELDPEAVPIMRTFKVYGTGEPIAGDGGFPTDIHVGSVIAAPFVWHIYEVRL